LLLFFKKEDLPFLGSRIMPILTFIIPIRHPRKVFFFEKKKQKTFAPSP